MIDPTKLNTSELLLMLCNSEALASAVFPEGSGRMSKRDISDRLTLVMVEIVAEVDRRFPIPAPTKTDADEISAPGEAVASRPRTE